MYFIICPKQEPKTEGVVLHRVAILGLFGLEQDQGFKPSVTPLISDEKQQSYGFMGL